MEKMSSDEVRPVNSTVPSEPEVGTVYDADAERLRSKSLPLSLCLYLSKGSNTDY